MPWIPNAPRFTTAEDDDLKARRALGQTFYDIAAAMPGRTYGVLRARYSLLMYGPSDANPGRRAKPKVVRSPRTCLRCRGVFASGGPGNRICKPCGMSNARQTDDDRFVVVDFATAMK